MKLIKFEHSCLDIQEGSDRLVIDPGVYSPSFQNFANVMALVITHVRPDHFDPTKVQAILKQSPTVQIFTTQEVADELKNSSVTVPEVGKEFTVGTFTLEFFGGQHAPIMPSYPTSQNYGVLVNGKLYYPGDSFTVCPKPHQIMATPVMAPWLKFSEVAELVTNSSAEKLFATHNGFVNSDGQALCDRLMSGVAEQTKKSYQFLASGESIEI
jgi:hypothetical protein